MLGGTPGTLYPLTGPLGQVFIGQACYSVRAGSVAMARRSKKKKTKKNGSLDWPIIKQPTGKNPSTPNGQSLARTLAQRLQQIEGLLKENVFFRKAYFVVLSQLCV